MTELEEEAFNAIYKNRDGVLQNELWKELGIDSRKCSRVVKKLIDDGRVERVEHRSEGIRTYKLIAHKKAVDPSVIIAGGEILPCICCELECSVEECPLLMDWMYQVAMEEFEEPES